MAYVAGVIWLTRPPYLRWLAAVGLILGSAAMDLAGRATEPVPFAASAIERGADLAVADVEWRSSPVGLIDAVTSLAGYAQRPIAAGDPITRAVVAASRPIPEGWWSVPVELPVAAETGQDVRLVGIEPGFSIDGVVAGIATQSAFGVSQPGLVAVPPEAADRVARALATNRLVILLGT